MVQKLTTAVVAVLGKFAAAGCPESLNAIFTETVDQANVMVFSGCSAEERDASIVGSGFSGGQEYWVEGYWSGYEEACQDQGAIPKLRFGQWIMSQQDEIGSTPCTEDGNECTQFECNPPCSPDGYCKNFTAECGVIHEVDVFPHEIVHECGANFDWNVSCPAKLSQLLHHPDVVHAVMNSSCEEGDEFAYFEIWIGENESVWMGEWFNQEAACKSTGEKPVLSVAHFNVTEMGLMMQMECLGDGQCPSCGVCEDGFCYPLWDCGKDEFEMTVGFDEVGYWCDPERLFIGDDDQEDSCVIVPMDIATKLKARPCQMYNEGP